MVLKVSGVVTLQQREAPLHVNIQLLNVKVPKFLHHPAFKTIYVIKQKFSHLVLAVPQLLKWVSALSDTSQW